MPNLGIGNGLADVMLCNVVKWLIFLSVVYYSFCLDSLSTPVFLFFLMVVLLLCRLDVYETFIDEMFSKL